MKKHLPERYRLKSGLMASPTGDPEGGAFLVPHKGRGVEFLCIMGVAFGWEHVSVTIRRKGKLLERTANWAEMCYIKNLFWGEEEAVMQLHPPKSSYVNNHPYCLHLWRPTTTNIPLPPPLMVGFTGEWENL